MTSKEILPFAASNRQEHEQMKENELKENKLIMTEPSSSSGRLRLPINVKYRFCIQRKASPDKWQH